MNKQPIAVIDSLDLKRLHQLADSMVRQLPAGTIIGLVGTLGAGKTRLVQSIAEAAGIDSADVTSPTFTLLQTHTGTITIHHLDAYRIADEDEFLELGVEELFDDEQAWTLVEWADRVEGVMPPETLWLHIEIETASERRRIRAYCTDSRIAEAFASVAGDVKPTDESQS